MHIMTTPMPLILAPVAEGSGVGGSGAAEATVTTTLDAELAVTADEACEAE